jgi:hypothetical protein
MGHRIADPAASISDTDPSAGNATMTKQAILATAASIFAATTFATAAHAEGVKCSGTNACKGQSACKGGASPGKGQNACKGQGFTEQKDAAACTAAGGKVL